MAEKEQEYKKLPLKSCEQIFAAIEVNLPSEYNYNENTKIVILDTVNENCSTFELPKDQIENINKIHDISKGTYIFDLFKNK